MVKVTEGEVEFKLRTSDVDNIKIEDVLSRVKEEFEKIKYLLDRGIKNESLQ